MIIDIALGIVLAAVILALWQWLLLAGIVMVGLALAVGLIGVGVLVWQEEPWVIALIGAWSVGIWYERWGHAMTRHWWSGAGRSG